MQIGRNSLSAIYVVFVAVMLLAIVTAPSVTATVALVLCLFTLYALNDVGGRFSLRLGQLCGGLLVLGGVLDVALFLWRAIQGIRVSFIDLVISCLFIALGWFTLVYLSKRGKHSAQDPAI